MFGFFIPRNYTEALEFDKANNNSKWYDATKAELEIILIGKNNSQQYCWCSLMGLMPLRSLSNCDYELKNLPRLILGPIQSNQVMGTDPVGSHHGTRNSRSNSINPTYPYQLHD